MVGLRPTSETPRKTIWVLAERSRRAGGCAKTEWAGVRCQHGGQARMAQLLVALSPSTGQVGAPDDRLTPMLPFHLHQRPLHRRRFDAAAPVRVRLVEESH